MNITCFSCNQPFYCGAPDVHAPCWCTKKPKIAIDHQAPSCRCEQCFDKALAPLRCFRMHVAYVGTHFSGYQDQQNARSVEGELKKALKKITGCNVKLYAAGRTDAGVHARGQVVSLELATKLSLRQMTLALASLLPPDVAVLSIDDMPLGFDARRQSVGKQYVYRITEGLVRNPFSAMDTLHVRQALDIVLMQQAASYFIGAHDFFSFRSSLCTALHARRYVWQVAVARNGALMTIDVRGNAFCLNMVRIMVGTLIEVGQKRRSPESIKEALCVHDRKLAGVTAKAHGLTLEKVYYPDDLSDALIPEGAVFPRYPSTPESWPY